MIRLERVLVGVFAAWCLWTAAGEARALVAWLTFDNPLLPPLPVRTLTELFVVPIALFTVGLSLAVVRLSEWGRAPRWRWIAGTYAVFLVALRMAGWV